MNWIRQQMKRLLRNQVNPLEIIWAKVTAKSPNSAPSGCPMQTDSTERRGRVVNISASFPTKSFQIHHSVSAHAFDDI
jgi:hypothetical protein